MNWIRHVVILFVFTSGLSIRSSAGDRSKLHPAERFELCVARNLTGSSMFDEEDKVRISKIVMETEHRMHELKADPASAINGKTMLRLFAAALACVVADCDSSVRPQREQACLTALEACAESMQEPVGAEVVKEIKKIFSAMNREISNLDAAESDNSAPFEVKKKESLEKEAKAKINAEHVKAEILEKIRERLEEAKEKKEEHSEKETEGKERPKRAYVPTFQYQAFSSPLQSNPTLESIIADKLLKSDTFKNFFTPPLSQEDSVFFSRAMVASGLSGYRYDIVGEALNAVTNAMYRREPFTAPQDYAYVISKSIASVLAAHELTFFADALGIGSSLVYQLDSMLGSNPSQSFGQSSSFGSVSVSSSGWASSGAGVSSQASVRASVQANPSFVEPSFVIPSNPQNDKTQFQNGLSYYLYESAKIVEAFCNGPFPGVYEVMNSAFADYGFPVASTIATVVSNSLKMLPADAACAQYGDVISEIVADIFDNNGLIPAADSQTVANKISDMISSNIQSNPSGYDQQQSYSGTEYELNPSFSDYSYSAPEMPDSPVDQYSDASASTTIQGTPVQKQNPVLTNSTEFSSDASPPVIQTSSKQSLNLPTELSSDGLYYPPNGSPISEDDTVPANNTWVIVDYPIDAADQTNQTSESVDSAPPLLLEPGPVIPEKVPEDTAVAPNSKGDDVYQIATPKMMEVTKVAETTTPAPLVTNSETSTVVAKSEVTTPAPDAALKEAFESQSKLSEFLLKEMSSSLKALNATSGADKKQPDLPETSTDVKIPPQKEDSSTTLKDSKPTEIAPGSQSTPKETRTEVQTSAEPPQQQNGPSDMVALKRPEPITDEVSALVFAEKISAIVSSSVYLIQSRDFQFGELCNKLNELAPLVDLPPLDVCSEIPMIDYLLHVLNAVTFTLAGE